MITLEELRNKMKAVDAAMALNDVSSALILLRSIVDVKSSEETHDFLPTVDEHPVIYGKGGYTDDHDPRRENTRSHGLDLNGKVNAVWLTVHVKPETKYRCVNTFLINENEAKGQTTIFINVMDKNGQTVNETVVLGTGYRGQDQGFDDYLVPGNAYRPVQHILADDHVAGGGVSFTPPDLGPVAIYISKLGDLHLSNSDVVGNLGLPYSHHVSFMIEFQER